LNGFFAFSVDSGDPSSSVAEAELLPSSGKPAITLRI
jgi:hypothetical protein